MSFTPRTSDTGMRDSGYWYSSTNPFYPEYGLPNCTCYAWGRFWEINNQMGQTELPRLSTRNAEMWYGNTSDGYSRGQTPKLGAVACWRVGELDGSDGAGHVAIVEAIDSEGNITCSNSAWNSTYFYMTTRYASNGYNNGDYIFQGFIYNPYVDGGGDDPPIPPPTPVGNAKKDRYNFLLFNRRRRVQNARKR